MRVDDSKTDLMCVSNARSYCAKVKLQGRNGEEIRSGNTLKILTSVTLDADCLFKSYARNARAEEGEEYKRAHSRFYKTMLWPSAEYSSLVWHSMLLRSQIPI